VKVANPRPIYGKEKDSFLREQKKQTVCHSKKWGRSGRKKKKLTRREGVLDEKNHSKLPR